MRASAAAAIAPRAAAISIPSPPRLVHAARGFSLSRTLSGLLRGRAWIGVLTVLLLGVVFMQVHMLKLNAGISRAVETTGTLERQNSQLRQEVSQLAAADQIEDTATALGMVMPQPGSVRYLGTGNSVADAKRAATTMTAPDPQVAVAAAAAAQAQAPVTAVAPATTVAPPAEQTPPPAAAQTQQAPVTQQQAPAVVPPEQPAASPSVTGAAATATGGATPTP